MSSGRVEVSYHAVVQGGSEKMMMMIMRRRYGGWDVIVDRGRMRCFFTGAPPILFLNTRNSIVRVLVDGRQILLRPFWPNFSFSFHLLFSKKLL